MRSTSKRFLFVAGLVVILASACKREGVEAVADDAALASGSSAVSPSAASATPKVPSIAPLSFPLGYDRDGGYIKEPARIQIETVADPHWANAPDAKVVPDDGFVFELGMGSGLDGLNLTTIPKSGKCSHVYMEWRDRAQFWSKVDFEIAPSELERLVSVLNENHFLALDQTYDAKNLNDGAQWILYLRTGGREKYVYVSNAFPIAVQKIARFVSEKLIDSRPELREQSKPVPTGSEYYSHLWHGRERYTGAAEKDATDDR